jgi:hypothetical protein
VILRRQTRDALRGKAVAISPAELEGDGGGGDHDDDDEDRHLTTVVLPVSYDITALQLN